MIKTKKSRSTRKIQSPINRGLKVNSRKNRYSKFCDVGDQEVVDVITALRGKRLRKKVRGTTALVYNKPISKVNDSLIELQVGDLDTVPVLRHSWERRIKQNGARRQRGRVLLRENTNKAREYLKEENKDEIVLSQEISNMSRVMRFVNQGSGGPQGTFCEFFKWLMDEEYNISKKQLSDLTGIDPRTITRMRTEPDYNPSLVYIVACCVAMGLLPWESETLIRLAGHNLRLGYKVERAYTAIIYKYAVDCSLEQCDEILTLMGLDSLTDIVKKNKK